MFYTRYDKLAVLSLTEDESKVHVNKLATIMLDRPSNMIYCERAGKLYGIISMGDIARAGKAGDEYVNVNFHFISVSNWEYMKAREIFKANEKINAIPVVDENNKLFGEYSRWDDFLVSYFYLGKEIKTTEHIAIVRPNSCYKQKTKLLQQFYEHIQSDEVCCEIIERSEILKYKDIIDYILFVEEDEYRSTDTLFKSILHKSFAPNQLLTFWNFYAQLNYEQQFIQKYLDKLLVSGVHILNLVFEKGKYQEVLNYRIAEKFLRVGEKVGDIMPPVMYPYFFDDLYQEDYANSMVQQGFKVDTKSGCGKFKDCHSKFCNITNGERYTVGQPKEYLRTIYFVGPCFIYGHYVEDCYTIESFLQRIINEKHHGIKVVNCGGAYSGQRDLEGARIMDIDLSKGDVIIFYMDGIRFRGVPELNLLDILEKKDVDVNWMVNHPAHCNHKINALYAKAIYEALQDVLSETVDQQEKLDEEKVDYVKWLYIDRYFSNIDFTKYSKVGSIVMNCNPFTYGHRYLIEQALDRVDFLIIFVVEEDLSFFSFKERFAMVSTGVADLKNVLVAPSGPFILSKTSFPEYFIKEADEELMENVRNDITFFAERIAPHLNIHFRFAGEEPEDIVTNEYNQAMKEILPKYGIEFVEFSRKRYGESYISASAVRACLNENDVELLEMLIPESTKEILFMENK